MTGRPSPVSRDLRMSCRSPQRTSGRNVSRVTTTTHLYDVIDTSCWSPLIYYLFPFHTTERVDLFRWTPGGGFLCVCTSTSSKVSFDPLMYCPSFLSLILADTPHWLYISSRCLSCKRDGILNRIQEYPSPVRNQIPKRTLFLPSAPYIKTKDGKIWSPKELKSRCW